MRKLLKKYAFVPERLVTTTCDHMAQRLALSVSNACMSAGVEEQSGRNSHQPIRRLERKM
jgi:hypothetical protein